MAYIIDGHNLIPKIPGMSLRDIDDEQNLIDVLQQYCTAQRRSVEVFFDKAPVGYAGTRTYGRVTAHFVREGNIADNAIRARLNALGAAARNASVVSSDRQVQAEARSHYAVVIPSEQFAAELAAFLPKPAEKGKPAPRKRGKGAGGEVEISQEEMDEFRRMFGVDKD